MKPAAVIEGFDVVEDGSTSLREGGEAVVRGWTGVGPFFVAFHLLASRNRRWLAKCGCSSSGAAYHVMCRGDRRENIFEDNRDRARFLETLGEVYQRTGWKIHAYVVHEQPLHLVLETPRRNLAAGMKWLLSTYTLIRNSDELQQG